MYYFVLSQLIISLIIFGFAIIQVSQEALAGILPSLSNLGLPANVTERLIQSLSSAEVLAQLTGNTGNDAQGEPGVIQYTANVCVNGGWPRQTDTIQFHWKDCKHLRNIRVGTKVVFDIHQVRRNKELVAANIRADISCQMSESPPAVSQQQQQFLPISSCPSGGGSAFVPVGGPPMNDCDIGTLMNQLLGNSNNNSAERNISPVADAIIMDNRNEVFASRAEKDCVSLSNSQEYLMRFNSNSNSQILNNFGGEDLPEHANSNGLYRVSSSDIEELGQGESYMTRKSSRSPSDSSDQVVINGSYEGYSTESNSPPQSVAKTPRMVMKGYIAALKDGFGFIETMAQDGEIFFHSRLDFSN